MTNQKLFRFKNLSELHKYQKRCAEKNSRKIRKKALQVPLETTEGKSLMIWCKMNRMKYPELDYIYHIPNGQDRDFKIAAVLKAEGLKPGVSDYCLPVARFPYHGLYIELKRIKKSLSRVTAEQEDFIDFVTGQDYKAEVCYGWAQASDVIQEYLDMPKWELQL